MGTDRKKYYMVGYTHIDPVWLWNRAEGMQEVKSSFISALDRLEEFPDFKFMHTSISYLAWLKDTGRLGSLFENNMLLWQRA